MKVAPLVGAWIERSTDTSYRLSMLVAPLVGAWIESEFRPIQFDRPSESLLL